jgi:dihydrofolate synthase/folylpolyglutamate synthase
MTYEQAMGFWFGRVNFEQRSPKPSDLKLDRMRALLALLGNPHEQLRIVHVAGSKGKGSTSAMLASILRRAGYRTGLFTSPHLECVAERIQVDDVSISNAELIALVSEVEPAVGRLDAQNPGGQGITFFEVATALGYLHFARRRVDLAVIEVGLGGRFDSTNVCRPMVSLITSISFDHTQQLGNTLARIAGEKAGIVKVGKPVISGARAAEARSVIEQICRQRGARLRQLDMNFQYRHEPGCIGPGPDRPPRVHVTTEARLWPAMELGLLGEHQAANAALAVAAVEELRALGLHIHDKAVAAGLAQVCWPARMEVVGRNPLVVLDCAHNLASVEALLATMSTAFPSPAPDARRLLIFAGNSDKDLAGMFELLAPKFDHIYLTRFTNNLRCAPPEQLANYLPKSASFSVHQTSTDAWEKARQAARAEDRVCITGSVFLAGELRPLLLGKR